jgi:hypothetical protein
VSNQWIPLVEILYYPHSLFNPTQRGSTCGADQCGQSAQQADFTNHCEVSATKGDVEGFEDVNWLLCISLIRISSCDLVINCDTVEERWGFLGCQAPLAIS